MPLIRALDWLLCKRRFGLRLLDPERIITRRLDPHRLITKARAIAGDGPFHLPEPLIEDRLRRAQAALRDANLKGVGAPGDLVVGLPAVAVLAAAGVVAAVFRVVLGAVVPHSLPPPRRMRSSEPGT